MRPFRVESLFDKLILIRSTSSICDKEDISSSVIFPISNFDTVNVLFSSFLSFDGNCFALLSMILTLIIFPLSSYISIDSIDLYSLLYLGITFRSKPTVLLNPFFATSLSLMTTIPPLPTIYSFFESLSTFSSVKNELSSNCFRISILAYLSTGTIDNVSFDISLNLYSLLMSY